MAKLIALVAFKMALKIAPREDAVTDMGGAPLMSHHRQHDCQLNREWIYGTGTGWNIDKSASNDSCFCLCLPFACQEGFHPLVRPVSAAFSQK